MPRSSEQFHQVYLREKRGPLGFISNDPIGWGLVGVWGIAELATINWTVNTAVETSSSAPLILFPLSLLAGTLGTSLAYPPIARLRDRMIGRDFY